jgi:hypothetical protein
MNEVLSFTVYNNLLTITAKFGPEAYFIQKEIDPDLDINDMHQDLSSNKFKILTQSPQLTKIKIGYLTLEFKNIK